MFQLVLYHFNIKIKFFLICRFILSVFSCLVFFLLLLWHKTGKLVQEIGVEWNSRRCPNILRFSLEIAERAEEELASRLSAGRKSWMTLVAPKFEQTKFVFVYFIYFLFSCFLFLLLISVENKRNHFIHENISIGKYWYSIHGKI